MDDRREIRDEDWPALARSQAQRLHELETRLRWALSLLSSHPNKSVREECAAVYRYLGTEGYQGHWRD